MTASTAPAGYDITARVRDHGVPTILRRWRKERGNRDYLEMLKRLQLTPAGSRG